MIDQCSLESKELISLKQALDKLSQAIVPIRSTERVNLKNALGRVLAQDIRSPINIPPERNSAMDGYALHSQDLVSNQPFSLKLVGTSWAGKPYQGQLNTGECIRIFTGGVVPKQADSVIMQEHATVKDHIIEFPLGMIPFSNVRETGDDIELGSCLLKQGKKITAVEMALLASAGVYDICIQRKINIAFFSTGDELTPVGQSLPIGGIYDSNRYALHGLLSDSRFNVADLGVIKDNKKLLEQALKSAAQYYDVIITTGGASVGEADYIQEILQQVGQVNFWKIAIKPGKPLAFGKIGESYFFGLPGNPVSVITTFQKIVSPALEQLTGTIAQQPLRLSATCTSPLKKQAGRQEFQRGILSQNETGQLQVKSAGKQGSHILSAISQANCYIILSAECNGVNKGETVLVEPFENKL